MTIPTDCNRLFRLLSAVFCSVVITACGGGGGSNTQSDSSVATPSAPASAPPATISVSGLVVDGYLKNAQVFLDLNDNGKNDSGEPSATTDSTGLFKFVATPEQVAAHAVVAIATANSTIDMDNPNSTINKTFILTAPVGKYSIISPITTAIAAKVATGLILKDAENKVLNDLNLNGFDPYKDHLALSSSDPNYSKSRKITSALVVALKSVEAYISTNSTYIEKLSTIDQTFNLGVVNNVASILNATTTRDIENILITSGSLLEDRGRLLASTPKLLPDLRAKYEKLCGLSANMQNVIPIDLNKDGRKDLLLNLWCTHTPSGEPYTGPVPNTLIALIQDKFGNFSDQTRAIFGVDMPTTDGKGHIFAINDFNGDGYQDIVMSMDREDGRSIADDNAKNLKAPTLAIMSKGDGTYSLSTFGDRLWGSDIRLIKNSNGQSIVVVLPAGYSGDPQAWIYDNGWQKKNNYNWTSNFSSVFITPTPPDTLSNVAANAIGDSRGQFIQIWNRSLDIWTKKSEVQFTKNQSVPYIFSNGKIGSINISRVFNRDYIEPMLYEGCSFKPTSTSPAKPVFSMLGQEIVGGYINGQILKEPSIFNPGSIDLVTFDIDQNSTPINISSVARSNMDGNFWHISCEDINSDGFDDVVIRQNNRPIIFLNDGKGSLKKVDQSLFPTAPRAANSIYEDIDGDGIRDFLYYPMSGWQFEDSPGQISNSVNLRLYKGIKNLNQSNAN